MVINRLQQKLADNGLMRKRDEILSGFKGELQSRLTDADCILSDRIGDLVQSWHWPSPVIGEVEAAGRPAQWQHSDCDNLAGLRRMAGFVRMPTIDGHLWLAAEAPVMAVNCDIWNDYAWHFMNYVAQCSNACLALVAENRSTGLLISEYVGSLPKERRTNRAEIVYEMVTW